MGRLSNIKMSILTGWKTEKASPFLSLLTALIPLVRAPSHDLISS